MLQSRNSFIFIVRTNDPDRVGDISFPSNVNDDALWEDINPFRDEASDLDDREVQTRLALLVIL